VRSIAFAVLLDMAGRRRSRLPRAREYGWVGVYGLYLTRFGGGDVVTTLRRFVTGPPLSGELEERVIWSWDLCEVLSVLAMVGALRNRGDDLPYGLMMYQT
jgi:hypothetical protein